MTLDPRTQQPIAKIYRPSDLDALLRELELGGTQEDQVGVGEGTGGGGGEGGQCSYEHIMRRSTHACSIEIPTE